MTLDDAKKAVTSGVLVGDVYPFLTNGDAEVLKSWFVSTPGLPNLRARRPLDTVITGDCCRVCGSTNLTRAGACLLCRDCGDTSGGCG